jgi:hypothetical protein
MFNSVKLICPALEAIFSGPRRDELARVRAYLPLLENFWPKL